MKRTFSLTTPVALAIIFMLLLVSCRSAYYSAYEHFGVYKRDLLKKRVVEARDDQKEAQEQFKDALTRLKEITKFEGSALERAYDSLKSEYEDCVSQAETVRKRIRDVETVANDLFAEWEKELEEINTPSLRDSSRQQLIATRQRYDELHSALTSAGQSMSPVLSQFKDYVLYLKHNLNAQAIASLKGETTNIQNDIARLIDQMNRSIARADEFVKTLK
jgi:F0F1-type ATP synthase membrane subunit b/b'